MRNMSFALTTDQVRAQTKHVTRRLGWANLQPGQEFCAVVKGMGLKKGQQVERLAILRCTSNQPERLDALLVHPYGKQECIQEGFPTWNGAAFVEFFCQHNRVTPDQIVNRIAFEYVRMF